jgi:hypothetical protein
MYYTELVSWKLTDKKSAESIEKMINDEVEKGSEFVTALSTMNGGAILVFKKKS